MKKLSIIFLPWILGGSLWAQPNYFNYQGLLKDNVGDPLDSGAYTMEFNIFDAALDGALIWGPFLFDDGTDEGHSKLVQVANGQFNVILGPTDTSGRNLAEVFSGDSAFVQLSVNGGIPILPRQQILSTPYSFKAATAATLEYLPPVQYRNPAGMIAPFAGTVDKIPEGWLLCDGSEFKTTDHPELFDAIGQSWGGRQEVDGETVTNYFKLPDLRGMFLRGANNGRDDGYADPNAGSRVDGLGNPSEDSGSLQGNTISVHRHVWGSTNGSSNYIDTWDAGGTQYRFLQNGGSLQIENGILSATIEDNYPDVIHNRETYTKPGSTVIQSGESRPNNAAVNYIIKL
ncbi:MAG: tail fiber protein [Verrucomicrobiae bacterium]|nr:tail fiber protein [Verrucomicrobiae bacterium]